MEAMSRGITETVVRSIMSTSSVKSMPAMGALKMPAMPAAAPHPTMIMSTRGDMRKSCPTAEPIEAPEKTMGPSAPTEPPKPMVTELAQSDERMLWRFRRLLFCEMA